MVEFNASYIWTMLYYLLYYLIIIYLVGAAFFYVTAIVVYKDIIAVKYGWIYCLLWPLGFTKLEYIKNNRYISILVYPIIRLSVLFD